MIARQLDFKNRLHNLGHDSQQLAKRAVKWARVARLAFSRPNVTNLAFF